MIMYSIIKGTHLNFLTTIYVIVLLIIYIAYLDTFFIEPLISHLIAPLYAAEWYVPQRGWKHCDRVVRAKCLIQIIFNAFKSVVVLLYSGLYTLM